MRSDAGSDPAPERSQDSARLALAAGIVLGIIALDQLTKVWAVAALSDGPTSIVGTTVELRLSRNTGGAFSLFQQFTPVLAVLAVVVAIVLVRVIHRTQDRVILVALALVLAGAVGNLLDRVFRSPGFLRGAVVDFVGVGRFPTFNVADSAITIGAILLVLWGWRRETAAD
ncbi:MAG TPA: signal peptidase II [Acidimicrobiia bacterium]